MLCNNKYMVLKTFVEIKSRSTLSHTCFIISLIIFYNNMTFPVLDKSIPIHES